MSFYLIRIIAVFEMRTLLRSWFFRIFTGGAIFGLGIFNIAMNVEASGAPWIYKALSCSVPYANMIILNLGQAIVAIFLGSEFLKQDRKNDSIEVIYARSMSNSEYIIGKTLGVLAVFLVLNMIILVMGIGFSFISNVTSKSLLAYLAYPMLISLPTLVFILGLSFYIMVLVKNQAVTFILLTGYIALTVFYLNKKAFHLFDYIAYQVPMIYSSISGFGSLWEIILHRSIYLVAGIGLISLTIYKLQRLPQSNRFVQLPLITGIILLGTSALLVYVFVDKKLDVRKYRDRVIALNNRYINNPKAVTDSCSLDLEHSGRDISVNAELRLRNPGSAPIDTLIMSLNPGLNVSEVLVNGKPAEFSRDLQILRITLPTRMIQDDVLQVGIKYQGRVTEKIAFLDQSNKVFEEDPVFEVFRLHKRYAFIQPDYICLTSDVLWYPVTGAGYATAVPMHYDPDFARYRLKVKTSSGLTALSQGKAIRGTDGVTVFEPEYPLSRISLLAGNYQGYSVTVDSVNYAIYVLKGHDYFSSYFKDAADTIPSLIRELKKEYEAGLGLTYPFKRLTFAEVPVHFALNVHTYSYASDAVQPEMIFCPENGVLNGSSDFRGRKYRLEKNMKNNNEEVMPVEVQADLFKQFFKVNFMSERGFRFDYERIMNWHTYSLFPQYFSFYCPLSCRDWPVLRIALETYVSERNNNAGTTIEWYEDLTTAEKINLELENASLKDILIKGIDPGDDERNPLTVTDLVQVKGLSFFNTLSSEFGSEKIDTLINSIIREHSHQPIQFSEMNRIFSERFGVDLSSRALKWYTEKELPGFIIRDISSYKVTAGEATKNQVRFLISNPENTDGVVTLNIEFNDPNRKTEYEGDNSFKVDFSKKIFMPARSSFEVGYVFNTEPARMSVVTHVSRNLPNNLIFGFNGFTETRNVPVLDEIRPVKFFDKTGSENEFIADNEDKDFSYLQTMNQAYLKSMVRKNQSDRYKYSSIWWWNPPREWRAILRSEFYGYYVRSAYYTRGGAGERTATWKTRLPKPGSYDIYYYVDKVDIGWRRNNKATNYNLTVFHDTGSDKIDQSTENVDPGWNYLGTWYISSDSGRVELSNKSNGEMVYADAVKWVLNK